MSNPVNEEFAKIFMQLHYMEQSGKGVPTIVKKYGRSAYRFGSSFIQCVFPYDIIDKNKQASMLGKKINTKRVTENVAENVTGKEREVLVLLSVNPRITSTQIAGTLGVVRQTVYRVTKSLKEKGIIERVGSDKKGHLEIVKYLKNVSIKEFKRTLNDYLIWYCEKRIKNTLGGLSPMEYRRRMGLI